MKTRMMTTLLALLAMATMAKAQDLYSKYATRLLKAGTEAPDMAIGTSSSGDTLRLSSLRGQYVLIHFWASWCPDCRRETPALKRIYAQYATRGLQMVGVSYDTNRESWQKYVSDNAMAWTQYSELRKWKKETTTDRLYHIDWIPTLYLIGPDGRVALSTVMIDKVEQALAQAYGDQ